MAERKRLSTKTNTSNKNKKKKALTTKNANITAEKKEISATTREIWAIVTAAVGVLLVLGFYFDALGALGSVLKISGLSLLGVMGYALPVVLFVLGICFLFKDKAVHRKGLYMACIVLCVCAFVHLFSCGAETTFKEVLSAAKNGPDSGSMGGGLFGALVVKMLSFTGVAGTAVILIAAALIFSVLISGATPAADMKEAYLNKRRKAEEETDEKDSLPPFEPDNADKPDKRKKIKKNSDENMPDKEENGMDDFVIITDDDQVQIKDNIDSKKPTAEELMKMESEKNSANTKKEEQKEKENLTPVSEDDIAKEIEKETEVIEYTFPPIDLLRQKPKEQNKADKPEDLRQRAAKLIETLKSFGVDAKILEVTRGPSVTRFEIQPSVGVKVSKIVNLADDIALNLAAYGVRIEAPIPGKAAVGIEIPNQSKSMVSMREVIESPEFKNFNSKTAFALGKDIAGQTIIADVAKMPHVLIAGTTGSGKSVCINSLITSIIYKARPDEVKLLMIDPKRVELGVYNGIPHLLIPVVTDPRKAAGALNWAVTEMIKRYNLFAECNVRDMNGYNEYAESEGLKKMENVVIIIDELADLMMVAPKDVEDAICRLAQMARAAGMHLVVATQSPRVDVITGLIKANIPSRIAFTVSNATDSRIILDMMGAEKLLGKGDMLFLPVGASKPTRIQGAYISDKERDNIIDFIKGDYEPVYDEDIIEKIENGNNAEADEDDPGDADEYLNQAIELVIDCGQASVSLIQRKFPVGYARAGRIIDQMEKRGIIGPHEGSKPRQVLMTKSQFYEMMMHKDEESEESDS
ncbi:MAG: DNA translocase FtsK [Clostridia bacterium]|nr:DNA translocase FtsK [Clostridia bacterium]